MGGGRTTRLVSKRLTTTRRTTWSASGRLLGLGFALWLVGVGLGATQDLPKAATPPSQKFAAIYDDLEAGYERSEVATIEAFGRAALKLKGPDRLYRLWSVLYVYKDHMVYSALRRWIDTARAAAAKDHDARLAAFADFFQFSLEQDGLREKGRGLADWSRFLNASGPDVRLMALVEVIGHCVNDHEWTRASDSALAGLSEIDARGPQAMAVKAELHQQYANALSAMGYTDGAIDHSLQAIAIDRRLPLRTQALARIYDLTNMAVDAGDLDAADHLARIHFRLAQTSRGPNPRFWTRYLCATVAEARQDWPRILECTKDLAADLAKPKTSSMANLLAYRAMARARLGDARGARADLNVLSHPADTSILRDTSAETLIRDYIDEASGRHEAAFNALDKLRRDDRRAREISHRQAVGEVVKALDLELHREREQTAQLSKMVQTDHTLTLAWRVIAALCGLITLGGLGWAYNLRRQSRRLSVATRQAEAASKAKTTFLAVVSHELRTPLNGLLGMAHMLKSTPLSSEQRDLLDTLSDSGDCLLAILNDILDLSKMEAGHIEIFPEAGDIRATCETVIKIYQAAAAARGNRIVFAVETSPPAALMFDALRVRQCVANLVSNAVKFTDNGVITVRLGYRPADAGAPASVQVDVTDTGIGMSADTINKLFGAFVQADASTTRRFGGTGLGLNITMQLAQRMGGGVSVQSREGEGSTFTLTLSVAEALAQDAASRDPHAEEHLNADAPSTEGLRVLVVDDHPVNRKVARLFLDQAGCIVSEAENGLEALEHVAREGFDLVLMDINMPEMDGFEATRRIRQMRQCVELPIIAVTADATSRDIEKCRAAGLDRHLAKPIRPDDLFTLLAEFSTRGGSNAEDRRSAATA